MAYQHDLLAWLPRNFTLLPAEARVIRDALPTLFQMTGVARLRYGPADFMGDGIRVTSRTYNVNEGGIPQPKAALIVIEVSKGLIGAYATLTDNVTNDSSYLGANLAAQPN